MDQPTTLNDIAIVKGYDGIIREVALVLHLPVEYPDKR